jgi:hypothetical protein
MIFRCAELFMLPIAGALLTILAAQMYVSHDDAICHLLEIKKATPTLSGRTIAASYYLTCATAVLFLICCANFSIAVNELYRSNYLPRRSPGLVPIIVVATLALAIGCSFVPGAVDDNVVRTLFAISYGAAVGNPIPECSGNNIAPAGFVLGHDAKFYGVLVFASYMISAAAGAVVVATSPGRPTEADTSRRISSLNRLLFSTAAVLVAAIITTKFRFDLGLAALGTPPSDSSPNVGYVEYQAVANAISAYMAIIQSVFLALLYVPSTMLLSPQVLVFEFSEANFFRLAKVLAIFSPPLVSKLMDVFSSQ